MKKHLILFTLSILFFSCKMDQAESNSSLKVAKASLQEKVVDLKAIMGKYEPSKHIDFIEVAEKYADRSGMYLHKETYNAFIKMYNAAKEENIDLVIRSATRNFDYQKGIWERKWNDRLDIENEKERALDILKYSSMPGSSRHHWGTDIDFNAFENTWFEKGKGLKLYDWLVSNASNFGFCQPYSPKGAERPEGYSEEKWHWSYLPIANKNLDVAAAFLNDSLISGFKGSSTAVDIGVVEKYVLGINQNCK